MQFLIYFLDSVLALNFQEQFGIQPDKTGYVYIPAMVVNTIMCPITGMLTKKVERRTLMALSFGIASVSYLFTGPS